MDIQIVLKLRQEGHDVVYIAEMAPAQTMRIFSVAADGFRILVTRDKDFGELAYRDGRAHAGIILTRLHELPSETKAEMVIKAIQDFGEELKGAFTVLQPGKIRIRKMR